MIRWLTLGVINHAHESELSLEEMLADLRAETADRLDPHGVSLVWALQGEAGITLTPANLHVLRSVIRRPPATQSSMRKLPA